MAGASGSVLPDLGLKRFETVTERAIRIQQERKVAAEQIAADIETLKRNVEIAIARIEAPFQVSLAVRIVAREVAMTVPPRRTGAGNPVVTATTTAAHSVVNAITQIDRLFAANPPDP